MSFFHDTWIRTLSAENSSDYLFDGLQTMHKFLYIFDQLLGINYWKWTLLTHEAFVEDIAIQEALFEAALDEMGKFGPLHEYLILKALRQYVFNLLCNVSISEPI